MRSKFFTLTLLACHAYTYVEMVSRGALPMTASSTTIEPVSKKRTTPSDQSPSPEPEKKSPKRRPAVTLFARVEPDLGNAFKAHVETIRPKTSDQAVIEMLIERYLKELGLWPPPADPDAPATE
jgi:hypothetical protein